MRDKLYALLRIGSGEESMASMFLTQSILLGIFLGAYDISAHSLLLSTFDVKILARGYIVSGFTGIIMLYLFSWFRARVQFKNFAVINLSVVTALTLILWTAVIYSPAKPIIFILFIMFGPLNILALLGLLDTADRLFPRGQSEKLRGLGDTGIVIGVIFVSFIIPLLLFLKFQLNNVLLVSVFSVLVATIFQSLIGKKFSLTDSHAIKLNDKPEKNESFFIVVLKDPYIRIIFIFAVFSVITASFIQYSFMAVTRQQYPVAEEMAIFLGIFTTGMMIILLFFKHFIFKYIVHNYGLRICLTISPVLIALFTAMAAVIGLFLGFTPESTIGFIIFFFLIALTRLFSKSLSNTVEALSLKIICQSLDKKIKFNLGSVMIATLGEMIIIFSGIILTGIGLLGSTKLVHFSIVLFIICIIWFFIALKLFKEHKKSIIKATEKVAQEEIVNDISEKIDVLNSRFSTNIAFRRDYFSLISSDYSVLGKTSNKKYFEKLTDYANSNKDINLIPALKRAAANVSLDEEIRKHSAEVAEMLKSYSASIRPDDEKVESAKLILSGIRMPQTTEILRLLRDNSIEIKRLAIYMIGKFRISDLMRDVCECMIIPGLTMDAYEVLKSFGSGADDEMMRLYFKTSGNIMLSKIILRLLGNSHTEEAVGFMYSRLWSNSRQQKEIAVKSLINCKYKPSEEEKQHLDQLASDIIGYITWDLSVKISLEKANDGVLLEKIDQETDRWNKFLFDILSITYNTAAINRIRECFGRKTMESVNYAFEMTDIVVSEALKPKLIALLDFVPDGDKLNNLFQFYPGEILERNKLLEDIINRDYNQISLFAKACAIRSISKIDYNDLAESVTALLFSPEEIIQEESANLIARSNPDLYTSASARIPDSIKKRLDNIMNGTTAKKGLLFEKVQFLSEYFKGIDEDELLPLAGEMKYINNFDIESVRSSEGCIIWFLYHEIEVYVLYKGQTDNLKTKLRNEPVQEVYLLTLGAIEEYLFQFPDKSFEILKYIDTNE